MRGIKGKVVRTLLNMKCKSIDGCTSSSCKNLPWAKSLRKNRIDVIPLQRIHQRKQLQNQKMPFMGPIITTVSEKKKVILT